jgi:hypothetical protein
MEQSEHKQLSSAARGWAVFFSVLLGVIMLFVLLVITLKFTFFNPNFIDKAIIKAIFTMHYHD